MALLNAFGATKIAEDVKELIGIFLMGEDWDMMYSNRVDGFVFHRKCNWSTRIAVEGGEKEGEVVVTVRKYQEPDFKTTYRGPDAALDAAIQVMVYSRD